MMGANQTQEIGSNRVAYYYLYGSSDWHSHEFATIHMPQVLAYIRKQEIYGTLQQRNDARNANADASPHQHEEQDPRTTTAATDEDT
eukprot:CAMPEP_0118952884 /NCGR_PEP_ID=MMETSP1169-20130426/55613_1 /TAXON_ID=36882 /ORGANISM="Pyramimonas obovata, Strain CCMP722" /LENGTH=86 /DNA_ID=CAMNT_0006900227 /DNA_START=96 /DNA_END=353 /DNA_ORIENTATION=+